MKLIYKIPDKLYYFHQVLDYHSYKQLHHDVFKNKKLGFVSTKEFWQPTLVENYKHYPDRLALNNNYRPLQILKILLNTNRFIKINCEELSVSLNSMGDGSGINWHEDGIYEYGITYYINRRWHRKFGGELLYMEKGNYGFIPPMSNSLLIIKCPLNHKVAPVMNPLVPRKTLQIFVPKA